MDKRLLPDHILQLHKSVISNDLVCFGTPTIEGTRIHARVIAGFIECGDDADFIASEYGITKQNVKDCVEYFRKIKSKNNRN